MMTSRTFCHNVTFSGGAILLRSIRCLMSSSDPVKVPDLAVFTLRGCFHARPSDCPYTLHPGACRNGGRVASVSYLAVASSYGRHLDRPRYYCFRDPAR